MKSDIIIQKFTDALSAFGFLYVLLCIFGVVLISLAWIIHFIRVCITEARMQWDAFLIRQHQKRVLNTQAKSRKIENLKNFN